MMEKPCRRKLLEASVLAKSKRFIPSFIEDAPAKQEGQDQGQEPQPPMKKKRKPRHGTVEGQLFLKQKEKARLREGHPPPPKNTRTNDPDSDSESPPKKRKKGKNKKKKKKGTPVSAGSEKGGGETEDRYRNEALSYLQLWKSHRALWKFNKFKQVWLLKHALSREQVGDALFEVLLEYVASIKGRSGREKTRGGMQERVEAFERKFGFKGAEREPEEGEKVEYQRAREMLQILMEEETEQAKGS